MLIRILLLILFLVPTSHSVEIAIRAKTHWMDTVNTMGWSQNQLDEKARVTQKGSPILLRPDGFIWGSAEKLPDYIIIKLPGVSKSQVKKYVNRLYGSDSITVIKERPFKIPEVWVDSIANYYGGIITTTPAKIKAVMKEYNKADSSWQPE